MLAQKFRLIIISTKHFIMPDPKVDKQGFSTSNADEERDIAGKGGPAIGPGIPDDKHTAPASYAEDTQSQLAAKSAEQKKKTQQRDKDEE
jgi:hypothetical protein